MRQNEDKGKAVQALSGTKESPPSEYFSKKSENFRNVQLNIFQVQQMFIILLLRLGEKIRAQSSLSSYVQTDLFK